jgi:hypothetical protein
VLSTSKTLDRQGGKIQLAELTLDVWLDCLASTAMITVRRYPGIGHAGAIGPVFEIEVPSPSAFINDPQISIAISADMPACDSCTIGFLVPSLTNQQWVPDSPASPPTCPSGVVCGPLQKGTYFDNNTTIVQFAIVKPCPSGSSGDCGPKQACNAGACQQCPTGGYCNP